MLQEKFERVLYVTDAGQRIHFEQVPSSYHITFCILAYVKLCKVFKVAEMAGWYDPKKHSLEHVPFGLVLGENGGKLSSRDGP